MEKQLQHTRTLMRPLPLALLIATMMVGCGGGGNSADSTTAADGGSLDSGTGSSTTTDVTSANDETIAVSGKVINVGYIANTQVCADADDDGLCGTDEPSTVTDAQGRYELSLASGQRGMNLLAVITPDSTDTAATTAQPITFTYGWTVPTVLEYPLGATEVEQNITSVSMVYYSRLRARGRSRESNEINTFRRIVGTPNINSATGSIILPIDFDYVAQPQGTLSERMYRFYELLENRTLDDGAALNMLGVTAYGYAMYNGYSNANSSHAVLPTDPADLADEEAGGTDFVAEYLADDHHYFRPNTDAVTHMREGLTETTGWVRKENTGTLESIGRRAITLSNGSVVLNFATYESGAWQPITVSEVPYFSSDSSSTLVTIGETDSQLPRTIAGIDGNRVEVRSPGNAAKIAYDVALSPATNFFIEEWVDEQQDYEDYYNGVEPTVDPFTTQPACAINYPGYIHQPSIREGISRWYTACFDYYTAVYYAEELGDINLTYQNPDLPGATFYDATLEDPISVFPATQSCGTDTNPLARIETNDISHCNWAVDSVGGHTLDDLFETDGVIIHSWNNVYGESEFTVDDAAIVAGTQQQEGLPQELTLTLNRTGTATSGTGTIYSPYGGWTEASYTPITEAIVWEINPDNPNMVLIEFPFLDVDNPLVESDLASDGSDAAEPAILSGTRIDGERSTHFATTWFNATFRMDQTTHSSINREKIAILLADDQFIVGQYFDEGYTFSERYFTKPGLDAGVTALNFVLNKLYDAGFVDE